MILYKIKSSTRNMHGSVTYERQTDQQTAGVTYREVKLPIGTKKQDPGLESMI